VASADSSAPRCLTPKGTWSAWSASDQNDDTLIYTVEIRGIKEAAWKYSRTRCTRSTSLGLHGVSDGEYRLRITASDLPGNRRSRR